MQVRAELLDQLFDILGGSFGSGFDVEYVGIGRYAADIKQAPLEVAIIVCTISWYSYKSNLCTAT